MDNKMRVGRLHLDGSWSGAIGAYLTAGLRKAESRNFGRESGRLSAPGVNTYKQRERVLRVLAAIATERDIEWMHKVPSEVYTEAKRRIVAQAMTDPRVKGEVKSTTIAAVIINLKTFVSFCQRKGWIPPRLADEILESLPLPAIEHTRFKIVPASAWPAIFEAASARHPVEEVALALGFYLLLRDSELRRLKWSDLNMAEGIVTFRRDKRNGASLTVPLAQELMEVLSRWQSWLKAKQGVDTIPGHWHVVPARARRFAGGAWHMSPDWPVDLSRPIASVTLKDIIKYAGQIAGLTADELRHQSVHLLRRSGAEDLYQRGQDVRIISELLGHGQPGKPNIDQTMRYLGHGVDLDRMRAAVDRTVPKQRTGSDLATVGVLDDARAKIASWVKAGKLSLDEGLRFAELVAQG